MADISKVQGPSGPPDSAGKKDKPAADADKFKQAMHKRVTEVSQVDPDEKKKRKRREESEEEDIGEAGPATPTSHVTPFSLEQGEKKASPLDMQSGGPGTSPMASAPPAPPSPPSSPLLSSSSSDEMEDDSGILEQESFIENIPSPPTQRQGDSVPLGQKPVTPRAPEPAQPAQPVQPQAKAAQQQPTHAATQPGGQKRKGAHEEKTGVTTESLEGTPASKVQDTTKFFEHLGQGDKEKEKGKTPLELEKEAQMQGIGTPLQSTPFAQALEGKEGKKVEETEKEGPQMQTPGTPEAPLVANLPPPPLEALPSYANLSPQVMDMFDRMVGVMTVMTLSGVTETTVTLNTPQFASSVFFGTQIIIQEFSTAPKAFNVQLNGTPQAIALFQGNADDLMAAFQAGNYNYRINRLDTGYLSERPLFKRKEKIAGKENEKETGENP